MCACEDVKENIFLSQVLLLAIEGEVLSVTVILLCCLMSANLLGLRFFLVLYIWGVLE